VGDFPPGRVVRRGVDDLPVVVVHETGGAIRALADPAAASQPAFDARGVRLRRHEEKEEKEAVDGKPDRYLSEAGHEHIH
jgi:hypothetical protein